MTFDEWWGKKLGMMSAKNVSYSDEINRSVKEMYKLVWNASRENIEEPAEHTIRGTGMFINLSCPSCKEILSAHVTLEL